MSSVVFAILCGFGTSPSDANVKGRCQRRSGIADLLAVHRAFPDDFPCLLQSAVADAGQLESARYDILFAFPRQTLILGADGGLRLDGEPRAEHDFLAALDRLHGEAAAAAPRTGGVPFGGGWFLFLGYELAGQVERRLRLPRGRDDFPVALAMRVPAAIINDHAAGETWLVAEEAGDLARLAAALEAPAPPWPAPVPVVVGEDPPGRYLEQAARVHDYIVAGDVFQVNLSRAWRGPRPADLDPAELYRRLCRANPAPYAGIARLPGGTVLSSSPERLLRLHGGFAETRPIAGTRPRGGTPADDQRLKTELVAHPKERAEHIMLIDLERNDLGRVCRPGSIEVNELMALESYAHVHHIVSNVRGRLREGVTPGQAIRAVFPGGTITGCPKERCMAIIAELEGEARGAYTGSMGYLNHDGDLDLNILIRTITVHDDEVVLRAGAGLVVDSVPERELAETRHKARGMLNALEIPPT